MQTEAAKAKPISFRTTNVEFDLIKQIAARMTARQRQLIAAGDWSRRDARKASDYAMDLAATHANGNPMDFRKLLAADDFNFAHDVLGIARHLDHETGQLRNFFSPRCSLRQGAKA